MKQGKALKRQKGGKIEVLERQLARALADYDNFRKRVERERQQFEKFASAKFALRALPIFDMLEDAQKHLGDSGIALTIEEFKKVLDDEGIEAIIAKKGMKFDEELHEAVEIVPIPKGSKVKQGEIAKEILSGWKMNEGLVIRPAKVKVYKK